MLGKSFQPDGTMDLRISGNVVHAIRSPRRDFFPDVPKMKSQLEWLQAVKSGDPARIRRAQINIAHRRAGLRTPDASRDGRTARHTPAAGGLEGETPSGRPGTSSGWATPGTGLHRGMLRTPAMTPLLGDETPSGAAVAAGLGLGSEGDPTAAALSAAAATLAAHSDAASSASSQLRAPPMSLDNFLAMHTSEDNASFSKVVVEEQQRKRIKVRVAGCACPFPSRLLSHGLEFSHSIRLGQHRRLCAQTQLLPVSLAVCSSPGRQE